jgi:predicted nuclease of predicted toxin-antitoxin system
MDGFVFTTPSGEKIVMRGSLESRNWARGQIKPSAPGTGDAALLDLAEVDGRVLLTLDRDFWQIAIERRKPPERSGVIFRRAGTCDTMYLREVSHVDHDGSRARG